MYNFFLASFFFIVSFICSKLCLILPNPIQDELTAREQAGKSSAPP